MQRWVDQWKAYWFPRTTTLPLSICRIVVVATQLLWFPPSFKEQVNLLQRNSSFIDPQLLIRAIAAVVPRSVFFTVDSFTVLYWVTIVAGVTSLLGVWTRGSVFVFALGNWIFVAHAYSYGDYHHPEAVFCIFLLLLAFAPSGERLSVDALVRRYREGFAHDGESFGGVETAMWPIKLVHVLLAMTYLSTGVSKLFYGGFRWMNGYTLQNYIFIDATRRDIPLGIWIAQHRTVCIVLSVWTLLFEGFFWLSLAIPWTAPYWMIGGILFHIGLYMVAGHAFAQHVVLLSLLLLFCNREPRTALGHHDGRASRVTTS